MKLKTFILSVLFVFSFCYSAAGQKWKWEKVNYTFPADVYILSVTAGNDFWLRTTEGDLIHYLAGKAKTYKTIISSEYSRLLFTATKNNEFFVTAMDNNWRTHFYHFSNGKWLKDPLVFRLPIQALTRISDEVVYAVGNFGTMLKFENNKWREIKTPLKSHINYIEVVNPEKIFLLTNSEGVYLFDGTSFKNIPFPEKNKWNIQSIRILSPDKIFAQDSKRNIYQYIDGKFVFEKSAESKMIFSSPDNLTYRDVLTKTDHSYNLSISFPSVYRFIDFKSYHKDSILFSEYGGTLYTASVTNKSYFTDFSKVLGITGNELAPNQTAGIFDLDKNGLPDIIAISQNPKESFTYFFNSYSAPFQKVITPSFQRENIFGPASAFLDLNCDTFTDFVIANSDTGGVSLLVYENDKKGKLFKKKSIPLSPRNNLNGPINIKPVDFDADGRMDLCVTYYYGPSDQTGFEVILKNSFLNNFEQIDTAYINKTRSWNRQSIFADFNNDGENDWFIANRWRKNKLLMRKNGRYSDEAVKRIDPLNTTETTGACAVDFDNDGDLDILDVSDQSFITLLLNDGNGFFKDATKQFGLDKLSPGESILVYVSVSVGDFNNDGFTDIFISDLNKKSPHNYLLINVEGKYFSDQTEVMQITTPVLPSSIAADIDNDGDLDIFTYGTSEYALWINNLDDNNYLKIKPHGIISNTEGWGTKIWIYESGHLNDSAFLKGYKQLGSEIFGTSQNSEYVALFGVDQKKLFDIKVKFYGGKEIVLRDLKPGYTYDVNELGDFSAFFYTLPRLTISVLQNREIQNYFLVTLITFFILYSGTRFGLRKYRWNIKLALGFVSLSLSVYWLILLLTINTTSLMLKYFLPVGIAAASIIIPNLVFLWMSRNQTSLQSLEKLNDELLSELMQFSHGAWALSNLNSLQLLFSSASENAHDTQYLATITERISTFEEMVVPRITSIIELSTLIGLDNDHVQPLDHSLKRLTDINVDGIDIAYQEYAPVISDLKKSLTEIKRRIYLAYSSNPVSVIQNTCTSMQNVFEENNITLIKRKLVEGELTVLIKNYELADIIYNCLQNSVRASLTVQKKKISIVVYRLAPKICIDIKDCGIGIGKSEWEMIFESGYSKGSSTGFGLFSAKEKLNKYGGRIFVKHSIPEEETVITIELNEGILL